MPQRRGPKKPPSQKKLPLTHFLCIPLVTPSSKSQLETSIETFRRNLSSDQQPEQTTADQPDQFNQPATHIHPKAIRPVGVLHCTLGVMSLLDKSKLEKAIALLQTLNVQQLLLDAAAAAAATSTPNSAPTQSTQNSTESNNKTPAAAPPPPPTPLTINLKGLASMHDPQNTSILYIPPSDPTQRLYPFCLALQKIFTKEGILLPDDRDLKLHATIVNTVYAKGRKKPALKEEGRMGMTVGGSSSSSGTPGQQDNDTTTSQRPNPHTDNAPLKFDARPLLEAYESFVWAEDVVLDRIAICEMGAKKKKKERVDGGGSVVGEEEEYTEVASVGLLG